MNSYKKYQSRLLDKYSNAEDFIQSLVDIAEANDIPLSDISFWVSEEYGEVVIEACFYRNMTDDEVRKEKRRLAEIEKSNREADLRVFEELKKRLGK